MRTGDKTPHLFIFDRTRLGFVDTGPATKLDRFLSHLSPHLSTNPPKSMILASRSEDAYEGVKKS